MAAKISNVSKNKYDINKANIVIKKSNRQYLGKIFLKNLEAFWLSKTLKTTGAVKRT